MTAQPHYIGSTDRAGFAMVHWPDSAVRGAAIICPPLAYEQVCAYRTLRILAERLASMGIATLRIDYDGTGNSFGRADDPARVAAWRTSILAAISEARSFGFETVTLIGVRFGGTLAADVATRANGIDGVVLWDPIESGRRYARTLRLMSATGDATAAAPVVAVAGIIFTDETLTDIAASRFDATALEVPALVVARRETAESADGAPAPPGHVDVVALSGTSALLDGDAERAVVPHDIVAAIAGWTAARQAQPIVPQPRPPVLRSEVIEHTAAATLVHTAMRIGVPGLFAVQTVAEGARPKRAVVMVNNGVASHVGPGRAWVDFAARCATEGWIALRLDLSGLGDSPARPGRTDNDSYPPSAGADLRVAADQLTSIGIERVAMLGLCSGALLGFDAALAAPQIDLLIGVNGRFDKPFAESRHDMKARAAGRTARIVAVPLTKAPLFPLFDAVPTWVWRLLAAARICASPTRVVESVLRRGGIRVVMVFGTDEWGLKALRRRGGRRFERVLRDPGVSLIEVRGLDHSMFDAGARALVQTTVLDVLRQADPHGALL